MATIPDSYLDLLQQKKAFANLATVMADGSPQVTPVWFDYADGVIRVNTAKGRVKSHTLKPGASIALAIMDPTTLTATCRSAAGSDAPSNTAPTRISTRWQRNTSGRTPTRFASLVKCASRTRSSRLPYRE